MPINVNDPEYVSAEKEYHNASSLQEKLIALRKMISYAPKHKGGENLRQQLTSRRKKLEQEIVKRKKSGKSTSAGIKKDDMQAVIIGKTNSGKSSLLKLLTNAEPEIAEYSFTTKRPIQGILKYAGTNIQIIENPDYNSEYYDKGILNSADTLLFLITSLGEVEEIEKTIKNLNSKRIILFNKSDKLSTDEKRKLTATLKSKFKKYDFIILSTKTRENIDELKERIFLSFDKIRVYTKEPGKEKTNRPIILEPNSTIKNVAEKILTGFSSRIKQTKIWGPSSKFPGQSVGLNHKLKDSDVVEFRTK